MNGFILLITQDVFVKKIIQTSLSKKNIVLIHVNSDEELFAKSNQLPIDALIIDVAIEDLFDINEIITDFRKIDSYRNTTVIMLIDDFSLEKYQDNKLISKFYLRNLSEIDILCFYINTILASKNNSEIQSPENNKTFRPKDVFSAGTIDIIDELATVPSDFQKAHILLADDSKYIRRFITREIEEQGYTSDAFANGQELLDFLYQNNIGDIIILDNHMPVKDGITTLKELKNHPRLKNLPVLFLSATTDKEQVVKALELGADDYIAKPFNNDEFIARIRVHLRIDILKKQLYEKNRMLEKMNKEIEAEKVKTDRLLFNTLPRKIVEDLKKYGKTEPETFKNVTVFLSDIVSFTKLSASIEPVVIINELNEMFTEFDNIMENNKCERIKTIGDAYLAVCGMPEKNPDHAKNIIKASIDIVSFLKERNKHSKIPWFIRIGVHTGNVVGGIVGITKYIYDIFGDTINTTARMESSSEPMKINISETTYNLVAKDYKFIAREPIEVKGKGLMNMYFIDNSPL
jgi:adenylate cyclase